MKLTVNLNKPPSRLTSSSSTQERNLDANPASPNRGTVVFQSYKLCRRTDSTDTQKIGKNTFPKATAMADNAEKEIQLAKVPSGNSTRPPPPNKYKIRKFQIDKVQYYWCTYCNKHFESLHYLNNHHK